MARSPPPGPGCMTGTKRQCRVGRGLTPVRVSYGPTFTGRRGPRAALRLHGFFRLYNRQECQGQAGVGSSRMSIARSAWDTVGLIHPDCVLLVQVPTPARPWGTETSRGRAGSGMVVDFYCFAEFRFPRAGPCARNERLRAGLPGRSPCASLPIGFMGCTRSSSRFCRSEASRRTCPRQGRNRPWALTARRGASNTPARFDGSGFPGDSPPDPERATTNNPRFSTEHRPLSPGSRSSPRDGGGAPAAYPGGFGHRGRRARCGTPPGYIPIRPRGPRGALRDPGLRNPTPSG
jgi:hypothetical protein